MHRAECDQMVTRRAGHCGTQQERRQLYENPRAIDRGRRMRYACVNANILALTSTIMKGI